MLLKDCIVQAQVVDLVELHVHEDKVQDKVQAPGEMRSRMLYALAILECVFWLSVSYGNVVDINQPAARWASNVQTVVDPVVGSTLGTPDETAQVEAEAFFLECALQAKQSQTAQSACPAVCGPPLLQKQTTLRFHANRQTRAKERHEVPPQKGPRKYGTYDKNKEPPPIFVHLSALLLVICALHAFAQRLQHHHAHIKAQRSLGTNQAFLLLVCKLVQPILTLQNQLAAYIIDVALLALFGAGLQHLGQCSNSGVCALDDLFDGGAAAACACSIATLLHRNGGPWVQRALGTLGKNDKPTKLRDLPSPPSSGHPCAYGCTSHACGRAASLLA